jgi:hypothetical protein
MSDLLKNLRDYAGFDKSRLLGDEMLRAADEIERLRAERDECRRLLREACRGTCTVTADWYERAKKVVES